MVIQPNMSPKAISEIWTNTKDIFSEFNVPISEWPLEKTVETTILNLVIKELNKIVGSSSSTCIEGG
ncbi:hypothetical protein [Neobacillus terrae]|uniref:hypothetical protein n=1 Tax=Neobacillus terrae TaxID=3034837 RepID=UPI00140B4EF7|nr:hypothetical protein [Neobacillus terrae]NHM33887.1 hypothetical protein [Neobacillus terrae]